MRRDRGSVAAQLRNYSGEGERCPTLGVTDTAAKPVACGFDAWVAVQPANERRFV
jgi:hypothetical protein